MNLKAVKIHKHLIVNPEKIKWVQADINYSIIYLEDRRPQMCSFTLKKVEEILDSAMFYRIHRMFLVNLTHIEQINKQDRVILIDNKEFPVARRRFQEFENNYYLQSRSLRLKTHQWFLLPPPRIEKARIFLSKPDQLFG